MSYTYEITDFKISDIDTDALQSEIKTSLSNITHINKDTQVHIYFFTSLSAGEKTTLDNIVANYTYVEPLTHVSNIRSVVSSDGGDYTSIATAFSKESCIYVKNGVYYETSDIVIPSFGKLIGESTGGVKIVLIGTAKIIADGSGASETTGTISVSGTTVTGTGTTFTNLSAGHYILLGTNYFEILSIETNTSLTLKTAYNGSTISGFPLKAQSMISGIVMENIIICNSATNGLKLKNVRHSAFSDLVITTCTNNIEIEDCSDLSFNNIINYVGTNGIKVTNSISMSFYTVNIFNFTNDGFHASGCENLVLNSIATEGNNVGIYLTNSDTLISNCMIRYNTDGIKLYSETNVSDSEITDNGKAITCTGSIIMCGNIMKNIIDIDSDDNVISKNKITDGGLQVDGNKNIITGNRIKDCTVGLSCSGSNCIVKDNILLDNTSNSITATGNISDNLT